MRLCSACLLGLKCRYNAEVKPNEKVLGISRTEVLIPVCPEQLGGLETPRDPAEQKGDKVFSVKGEDVTKQFENGANEVLKLAKLFGIKEAILKQRSPSCGSGTVYDGSFSKKLIDGEGVTAALLKKNGIKVISEEDI